MKKKELNNKFDTKITLEKRKLSSNIKNYLTLGFLDVIKSTSRHSLLA